MASNKKPLSVDEREAVLEVMAGAAWPALMRAVDALVEDREKLVVLYNQDQGVERLLRLHAQAEGARQIRADLAALRERLVKEELKARANQRRP